MYKLLYLNYLIVYMTQKTIYYSNHCQHSKELLTLIVNNKLKNNFSFSSIETNKQIPPFIKNVPTLFMSENNNNKILVGDEIFNYINTTFLNNTNDTNGGDPSAWHKNEMGASYSDNYSFIDGDSSIGHSFSFLDNHAPNNISIDSNLNDNNISGKMSSNSDYKDKLSQDVEKLMAARDNEIPSMIQRI